MHLDLIFVQGNRYAYGPTFTYLLILSLLNNLDPLMLFIFFIKFKYILVILFPNSFQIFFYSPYFTFFLKTKKERKKNILLQENNIAKQNKTKQKPYKI